jgi:hypothetical protein
MKLTAETYRQYVERLHNEMNYDFLGEGAFGTVFQHPTLSNVAVKIVKMDSAYKKYAEWCKANRRNPWLPKIASVKGLTLDDAPKAYAVFMEKLSPVDAAFVDRFKFAIRDRFDLKLWSDAQWFRKADWLKIAAGTPAEFATVATYLANNINRVDLLHANFMRRGGQLVFTDPVA